MIDERLILSDPESLNGTPCFTGTRVPIRNLFDYLAHGHPLSEFFEDFPGVTNAHAIAVLHLASQTLSESARSDCHARSA